MINPFIHMIDRFNELRRLLTQLQSVISAST